MGRLALPEQGLVYLDTPPLVYTVERSAPYAACLAPIWRRTQAAEVQLVTSELTVLEALVVPLRTSDVALQQAYHRVLFDTELRLCPVSLAVLQAASALRAVHSALRTPDAIHIATAQQVGCDTFLTNDRRLRGVPGLPVLLLDDLLGAD